MYPPEVIQALKEALKDVYWYKNDLRLFLKTLDLPGGIVERQGWHDSKEYKVVIAGNILDELITIGVEGLGPIRRLIQSVLDIPNFDHLKKLEDGAKKVQVARRSVELLRRLALDHDESFRRTVKDTKARKDKVYLATQRCNDEIRVLQRRFTELASVEDHAKRGILFEDFLNDLFAAHDLNPRGSFKIKGEQIDGAFEFDGTQYLVEAKWRKEPQGTGPIDAFTRKVQRRLENTLGLFISLSGYTDEGLAALRGDRPHVVLFNGEDLALVLQGFVDFRDCLKQKVRWASQTGNPYLSARNMTG